MDVISPFISVKLNVGDDRLRDLGLAGDASNFASPHWLLSSSLQHSYTTMQLRNVVQTQNILTTSSMKAATADESTSLVRPACCRRFDSFSDFCHCAFIPNRRGITRVSSPQRTSGWASNIARISVVPLRGIPPIKISGIARSYVYDLWSCNTYWTDGLISADDECLHSHQ